MNDVPPVSVENLRVSLANSTAHLASLEAAVAGAQERLRREVAKAEKIRELIALFEADQPPATAEQPELANNGFAMIEAKSELKGEGSLVADAHVMKAESGETKQARMEREIAALLKMRGTVHRTDLLAHLVNAGIMGHESDPLAHLAAFLSKKRERFASNGMGVFSLRQSVPNEPPPAPNGVGSARGHGAGKTGVSP
jgi:hypothetical protein